LSTRKGACPKEKCSRVLVLGLRARRVPNKPVSQSSAEDIFRLNGLL
jgi:hypothetical protein